MIHLRLSLILLGGLGLVAIPGEAQDLGVQAGQKMAFFGDSNTAFAWENSTGYVRLVAQGLAMGGRQITVIPAGTKGDTSKGMLARLAKDVLSQNPDWMILSCGLNDVWFGDNGVPLDQFKQNVASIVEQATAAHVKVILLTSTMIGEDATAVTNQKLETYNGVVRSIAQGNHLPLVDLYADMQNEITKIKSDDSSNSGNLLTIDGVHLNGIGSEFVAKDILKALGMTDTEIAQAEMAWIELPNAMTVSPIKLSVHQYQQLQTLASQKGCSVDKLVDDTFNSSLQSLMNTNGAPVAPPDPQFPKLDH